MLIYNKGSLIIDSEMRNVKGDSWYSTDRYISFMRNAKRKDWADEEIVYNFNSFGYRTVELNEIEPLNFLLSLGCSYTEGVGLHESQIWPHHLKTNTNLKLFNMAKQATGCDIQAYNSMRWVQLGLPLPALVVIQWPYKARKRFATDTEDGVALIDNSDSKTLDGKWWGKRYIVDESEMHLNIEAWFELANNAWKTVNVPVLNFSWDPGIKELLDDSKYNMHYIELEVHDRARDGIHDGPMFHQETADKLLKILNLGNFTYKV